MRIAAIHTPHGKIFGAVEGDSFRPFSVGGGSLRDLRHVIKLFAAGSAPGYGEPVALAGAKLAAPVGPLTKNVICVGKNYYDHAREFAQSGVDQSGDKQDAPAGCTTPWPIRLSCAGTWARPARPDGWSASLCSASPRST